MALHTCVLREAGAVAVTLGDRDAMLGAHCPPVRGEGPCRGGRLALGECPLAGVAVAGAVRRLHTLPRHGVCGTKVPESPWILSTHSQDAVPSPWGTAYPFCPPSSCFWAQPVLQHGFPTPAPCVHPPAQPAQPHTLTGAGTDVGHVDEGPRVLDQRWVMQGDARAEALGVHCLAELGVGHWDRGFVIPCGRELELRPFSLARHCRHLLAHTQSIQHSGAAGDGSFACTYPAA